MERTPQLLAEADIPAIVGRSPVIHEVFALMRRLSPHARSLLISGEAGTGKEFVARAFHHFGPRCSRPFVTVNCSAVLDTLFEHELFGRESPLVPGARESKPGLFEAAQGGTLFLDEVAELPLEVQARLLRALDTGEFQRAGSLQPRAVDVAIVAATSRDLRAEVAAGRFQSDLYYRLNVIGIVLPPLRERREDIQTLAVTFLRECAARLQKVLTGLTDEAGAALVEARWEGNVRELRSRVELACFLAEGPMVTRENVEAALAREAAAPVSARQSGLHVVRSGAPRAPLEDVEREHILAVLRDVRGNRAAAAKVLGISRRALYRRLARHNIAAGLPRSFQPRLTDG